MLAQLFASDTLDEYVGALREAGIYDPSILKAIFIVGLGGSGKSRVAEAMFAGPISMASMNPARSLAPALVSWTWQSQWLYVAGPMIGAVLGAMTYQALRSNE